MDSERPPLCIRARACLSQKISGVLVVTKERTKSSNNKQFYNTLLFLLNAIEDGDGFYVQSVREHVARRHREESVLCAFFRFVFVVGFVFVTE